MPDNLYPRSTKDVSQRRYNLAPEIENAFKQFNQKVFEEGALYSKAKQLIAVAVAHVTRMMLIQDLLAVLAVALDAHKV